MSSKTNFKPHKMYKGSDVKTAKTFEEHKKLGKAGYKHTKPKGVNPKYTKGLTKTQAKKKVENIKKSRELVKKGKKREAFKLAQKRPTTKSTKKGSGTIAFKKKYGNVKPLSKEFEKKTGVPMKAQKIVFKRGEGAWVSAGSRSSVGNPQQWAYARLYKFVMDKGTRFDKDIVKEFNIKFK